MSQLSKNRVSRPVSPNVYTVLLAVAFAALVAGIAVLWMSNTRMTGQGNPFHIERAPVNAN